MKWALVKPFRYGLLLNLSYSGRSLYSSFLLHSLIFFYVNNLTFGFVGYFSNLLPYGNQKR